MKKKIKRLESVENDQVQLEVIQCSCGMHIGVDATYLDQVGELEIECPNPKCDEVIYTGEVCSE